MKLFFESRARRDLHRHRDRAGLGYDAHSCWLHDAVIRVYDESGKVIQPHKHKGHFQRVEAGLSAHG